MMFCLLAHLLQRLNLQIVKVLTNTRIIEVIKKLKVNTFIYFLVLLSFFFNIYSLILPWRSNVIVTWIIPFFSLPFSLLLLNKKWRWIKFNFIVIGKNDTVYGVPKQIKIPNISQDDSNPSEVNVLKYEFIFETFVSSDWSWQMRGNDLLKGAVEKMQIDAVFYIEFCVWNQWNFMYETDLKITMSIFKM